MHGSAVRRGARPGSVVLDKKVLDCFSTLGIEPTNNMCMIQRAYRDTVRMVHPDKIRHLGVEWTKDECRAAFENIRESYMYLKGQFNEIDLPDYDVIYLDEEYDTELKNSVVSFNLEEFNKEFTARRADEDDYATLGYPEFGTVRSTDATKGGTARSTDATKGGTARSTDATKGGRAQSADTKNSAENIEDALECLKKSRESIAQYKPTRSRGQLMKYLPDALLAAPTIQYSIIGETVNDFSNFSKSATLTDIRLAYENDYETWEETYRASSAAPSETDVVDLLAAAIDARAKLEPLSKDDLMQIEEKKRIEDDIERTRRKRAELRFL